MFGPTLAMLNQIISVSRCETESCATKSILFLTFVFILEPHFCPHPGETSTRLPPRSSFPTLFWIDFLLMTRSSSLNNNKKIPCATKLLNTKILPHKPKKFCMYLQEEPSTPPSDETSGDTAEATNPDEFT